MRNRLKIFVTLFLLTSVSTLGSQHLGDRPSSTQNLLLFNDVLKIVSDYISANTVPVLFVTGTDLRVLNRSFLSSNLGFIVENIYASPVEAHLTNSGLDNYNLIPFADNISDMPPININDCKITAPDYRVLLLTDPRKSKRLHYNPSIPVFMIKNENGKKTAVLNGFNFWRWKFLNSSDSNLNMFFNDFILSICQDISTAEDLKRVVLRTEKEVFTKGEDIKITGEVYDEFFRKMNGASFSIYLDAEKNSKTVLNPTIESGTFSGTINILKEGRHVINAEAFIGDKAVGIDKKLIYISRLNIEYLNLTMNSRMLADLSGLTGGKFIHISDLENRLEDITVETYEQVQENTFSVKRSVTVLLIIVFFLAIEWFFRKRWGLL